MKRELEVDSRESGLHTPFYFSFCALPFLPLTLSIFFSFASTKLQELLAVQLELLPEKEKRNRMSSHLRSLAIFLLGCATKGGAHSFLTLGDWGGAALGDPQYSVNVKNVATQLATTSTAVSAQFIVNTGDSFYCKWRRKTHEHPYSRALPIKFATALFDAEAPLT